MKKLLEYLVTSLADKPKKIEISETEDNGLVTFTVKADSTDMGKLIGKGGKIIRSLRSLMYARAIKENKRVQIVLQE
jgi:uncharacterized protein